MATETTLHVVGMHCGSCAERLSGVFQRSDGVIRVDVDLAGEARIRFDETRMDEQRLGELGGGGRRAGAGGTGLELVMITGDNRAVAEAVASKVGIKRPGKRLPMA